MVAKDLRVNIVGDADKLRKALGEADREVSGFGGKFGKLGKVVGAAALAAGAAVGAVAVKGVQAFAGFQSSMNEVFTLLPGITQHSMDEMSGQVKDFSKKFGVLPDEVVPALYQSLSAGVPQDNVFAFMETAQKAAKGGVTDLSTAVDGISSVVNAYGSDVMDATDASDLLFTAVRLGKTNFEELSANVSKVAPLASSLGLEFGDVTASLAALTAQGEGTAEASTKIRSALAELGKEGTAASKAFEDAAGKSFPEFIKEGGNLQEALALMADHAEDTDKSVLDLFGSVEAGSAAMMLTSDNGAKAFTDALGEMETASGATDAAFQQMEQGIGPVWEKLKAGMSVALLDVGDALAPLVEKLGAFALDVLPKVSGALDFVISVVARVADAFVALGEGDTWAFAEIVDNIFGNSGRFVTPIREATETVFAIVASVREVFDSVFGGGGSVAGNMGEFSGTMASIWANVREIFSSAITAITVAVETFVKVATALWDRFGTHIVTFFKRTWNNVQQILEAVTRVISGILDVFIGIFTGDWERFWGGIQKIVSGVWSAIHGILRQAVNAVSTIIAVAMGALSALWSLGWNALKTALSAVLGGITSTLDSWGDRSMAWFRELPGRIVSAIGNLKNTLKGAARDLLQGFIDGIKQKFRDVKDTLTGLTSKLTSWKGPPEKDRVLLRGAGHLIMDGLVGGLKDRRDAVRRELQDLTAMMESEVGGGAPGVAGRPGRVRPSGGAAAAGGPVTIVVELDGRTIGKATAPYIVDEVRVKAGVRR